MSGHRQVRSHKDEPYAFSSDDEGPFDRSHLKATNSSIRKHSSPRRSPRKANSPTVSLLDFDRDYVSYSPYEKVSPRRSRSKVRGGGLGEWCRQCVKWVQSETWRVMVVGLVMGVVFAILYQAFFRPRASTRGEYLIKKRHQNYIGRCEVGRPKYFHSKTINSRHPEVGSLEYFMAKSTGRFFSPKTLSDLEVETYPRTRPFTEYHLPSSPA